MVQWRDQGFVQDSDDEGEDYASVDILTAEASHIDPAEEHKVAEDDSALVLDILRSAKAADQSDNQEIISSAAQILGNRIEGSDKPFKEINRRNTGQQPDVNTPTRGGDPEKPVSNRTRELVSEDELSAQPRQHNVEPYKDIFDITSSGSSLSSHPSFDDLLDAPARAVTTNAPPHYGVILDTPVADVLPDLHQETSIRDEATDGLRRRNFRQRNPIQLHPYLLEQEQYRQSLRARGLKPVALASADDTQTQVINTSLEKSSLQKDFSRSPSSSYHSSSDLSVVSSLPRLSPELIRHNPNGNTADGEFLNIDKVYDRSKSGRAQNGFKRRKLSQFDRSRPSNEDELPIPSSKRRSQTNASELAAKLFAESSDSDIPVLTPRTTTKPPRRRRFRFPQGFKPAKGGLPTPITSSEPRVAIRGQRDPSSEPRSASPISAVRAAYEPMETFDLLPMSEHSDSSSSDDSEVSGAYRNRSNDVLPASWFTLDKHVGDEKDRQSSGSKPTAQPPARRQFKRGIAQHINNYTGSRTTPYVIEVSDDSENDMSAVPTTPKASIVSSSSRRTNSMSFNAARSFDEVVEDNSIDRMIPAISRNRKKSSYSRKKQARLPEIFEKATAYNRAASTTVNNMPRRRVSRPEAKPASRKPKSKRRPPNLSVLDFAAQSKNSSPQPDFIRLAIRQVQARPDRGSQNPYRKLISFTNRVDNAEAVSVLQDWKSGRISSARFAARPVVGNSSSRTPLVEASHNVRHRQQSLPEWLEKADVSDQVSNSENAHHTDIHANRRSSKQSRIVMFAPSHNAMGDASRLPVKRKNQNVRMSRSGQLEDLQRQQDQRYPHIAFRRQLFQLSRSHEDRVEQSYTRNELLTRFLEAGECSLESQQKAPETSRGRTSEGTSHSMYRRKKRTPQRLRVEDPMHYRMLHEPDDHIITVATPGPTPEPKPLAVIGLAALGAQYSIDFNIAKLPTGTFFHQSTFIGSGELEAALHLSQVDFDSQRGTMSISYGEGTIFCGPWNEDTASQLQELFMYVTRGRPMIPDVISVLRPVVKYFNTTLSFTDTIDRSSFISRIINFVATLHRLSIDDSSSGKDDEKHMNVELLMYLVIICSQTAQLGSHPSVPPYLKKEAGQILVQISTSLFSKVFSYDHTTISDFITRLSLRSLREAGIRDKETLIQAIVVLWHVLDADYAGKPSISFWEVANKRLCMEVSEKSYDVTKLEDVWRRLFSVIPLLNFDSLGILMDNASSCASAENWTLVKRLLSSTLRLHDELDTSERSSINAYVRATLGRCLHLIQYWKWSHSELVIYAVFDFFARRSLSLLEHEDSRASPAFLEHLSAGANIIHLEPSDASFHIFLKILLVSLSGLSSSYTHKKMRNIAWRFVPNHGRTYKKNEDLQRTHLEALRNHHDLLTVLYATVPPPARPQLSLVQQLVDYQASHSEVCLLSVRTWTNLVRFQLSTNEPPATLSSFGGWFNSIVESLLRQHQGARLEAEEFVNRTRQKGLAAISQTTLETTISKNQKQIASILHTAIASLISVVEDTRNTHAGLSLFEYAGLKNLFCVLSPKQNSLNSVIGEAVDAYRKMLDLGSLSIGTHENDGREEDSQDYGDWPMEDESDETDAASTKFGTTDESIEPLAQLLSNCFGSEHQFDEGLLKKVVDAWVAVANCAVKHKVRDWSYYLDPQSSRSWDQLRDTKQTRKFLPFYLSSVLDSDKRSFIDNRWTFLSSWLTCLVERESVIKFQHLLTTRLLNIDAEEPIVRNPPFLKTRFGAFYDISSEDFRTGRLGLISSVLYNIRKAHDETFLTCQDGHLLLRQEYKSLVKQLMAAMKRNFLEISAGSSLRGAYVEFVQTVVEFLQQYASDICPIDRFFTESSAFPLPAKDPLYIVGRLKSYGLKSSDEASLKKLAIFVQTVSERAAMDNHQDYLTEQLKNSTDGAFQSSSSTPSLRQLLMEEIFPAYIDVGLTRPLGWLFASPILDALVYIFDELLLSFNLGSAAAISAASKSIATILTSIQRAMASAASRPGMLSRPHILMVLSKMTLAVASALKPIDYLCRSSTPVNDTVACLFRIKESLHALPQQLDYCNSVETITGPLPDVDDAHAGMTQLRSFCVRELTETLGRSWSEENGDWYVLRGSSKKRVVVDVGLWEEEKASLQHAIRTFNLVLSQLPAFNTTVEPARISSAHGLLI